MKFDSDELVNRALPAGARSGAPRRRPPHPWGRTAQAKRPFWLQETLSLLSLLAVLTLLFILWRAAALLIRTAAGASG